MKRNGIILSILTLTHSYVLGYKIVGYYPNWSMYQVLRNKTRSPQFTPSLLPGDKLTHINYAFAKSDEQGNIQLFDAWADTDHPVQGAKKGGNFEELKQLKQKYPQLKTLISIGGWTLSDNFSKMAENPKARKNFAQNALKFIEQYGFDGIDIDWEYPGFADHGGRPIDTKNFTLLLKELSDTLKPKKYLLSIAAPAAESNYKNIELDKIHPYLDHINLMAYDFHGPWSGADNVTNHNAPLYAPREGDKLLAIDPAVQAYLKAGVPKEKLILGLPFYGRSFAGVTDPKGIFSAYSGPGNGTTAEKGIVFFSDIKNNLLKNYKRSWDDQAKVPYLYSTENKEFISYDDEQSIGEKLKYAKDKNLGGVMIWELSQDTYPQWDLLTLIDNQLK